MLSLVPSRAPARAARSPRRRGTAPRSRSRPGRSYRCFVTVHLFVHVNAIVIAIISIITTITMSFFCYEYHHQYYW